MAAAFEIVALLTETAKERIGQLIVNGTPFIVDQFSVSDGGHDPNDFTTALTPDPFLVEPAGTVLFGPELIANKGSVGFATPTCPVFNIVIDSGEGVGALSALYLHGRVLSGGITTTDTTADRYAGDAFLTGANQIGNSFQVYTTNQFAGSSVRIVDGTGAGQELPILSNDATILTVDGTFAPTPDATSVYRILDAENPDVGQTFLFAIANFPLRTKLASDVAEFKVAIQL